MILSGHSQEVPTSMPRKNRAGYSGSNLGDAVGRVQLASWKSGWQAPWQLKKKILGKRREDVGGRTAALNQNGKSGQSKEKDPDEMCPISCFAMPPELHKMIIAEQCIDASIDWEASDMVNALTHLRLRKHYTGVCWTDAHVDSGYAYLEKKAFEDMMDETQEVSFDPSLAKLLVQETQGLPPNGKKPRISKADGVSIGQTAVRKQTSNRSSGVDVATEALPKKQKRT